MTDRDWGLLGSGDRPPRLVRILAAAGRMSWQVIGITVALWILGQAYVQLSQVLLAIFVALVVAAIVLPIARWLESIGLNRAAAASVALLAVVGVLVSVLSLLVVRIATQAPDLVADVRAQRQPILDWLEDSPLSLSEEEVMAILDRGVEEVQEAAGADATDADEGAGEDATGTVTGDGDDAADAGTGAGDQEPLPDDQQGPPPNVAVPAIRQALSAMQTVGFLALGLVIGFFLVRDRDLIADGAVRHLVGGDHDRIAYVVIRRAWRALLGYVRASLIVGAVDAALIGVVLVVVGVPLAGVLTVLTFLAAFVPVVGAVTVGLVSAVVALISQGIGAFLIVSVTIVLVQQLDGNVLQPVLMRVGTGLHPVATILALTIGGILGGILGALLAVPITAMLVAAAAALIEAGVGDPDAELEPPGEDPVAEIG